MKNQEPLKVKLAKVALAKLEETDRYEDWNKFNDVIDDHKREVWAEEHPPIRAGSYR